MALPKALLCILGQVTADPPPEEMLLRSVGFATATVPWRDMEAQQRGWTQILPLLDDRTVQAWVVCGHPSEFTDDLLSNISMLTMALTRPAPPLTAFVLTGPGEPTVGDALSHVKMFHGNTTFAAKLMAMRMKPSAPPKPSLHLRTHLDPYIGQWIELGPEAGSVWPGFMAGVVDGEVVAFGIGPHGKVPEKSILHYPQCGIRGNWGEYAFTACAARNDLPDTMSCFMRVEGTPRAILVTAYPQGEDDPGGEDRQPLYYELY